MIRSMLSVVISGLCLGLGLQTARVQNKNYNLGSELDEIKRGCDLLEAGAEALSYEIDRRLAEIDLEGNKTPSTSTTQVEE